MLKTSGRGDTIIEVLLAVTVFSLVAVGTIAVMNQGTSSAQRALEITLVKEQIDSQTEALRAAQQSSMNKADDKTPAAKAWKTIEAAAPTGAIDASNGNDCPTQFAGASVFAMNASTAAFLGSNSLHAVTSNDTPYSHVDHEDPARAYGLWIESTKIPATDDQPAAYDFTVHACWDSVGTNHPMRLQTVVRLYDAS